MAVPSEKKRNPVRAGVRTLEDALAGVRRGVGRARLSGLGLPPGPRWHGHGPPKGYSRTMDDCCKTWVKTLSARTPKKGKFTEKRQCPQCRAWHMVGFRAVPSPGPDGDACTVLGIQED